jgi:hypothetical protein
MPTPQSGSRGNPPATMSAAAFSLSNLAVGGGSSLFTAADGPFPQSGNQCSSSLPPSRSSEHHDIYYQNLLLKEMERKLSTMKAEIQVVLSRIKEFEERGTGGSAAAARN